MPITFHDSSRYRLTRDRGKQFGLTCDIWRAQRKDDGESFTVFGIVDGADFHRDLGAWLERDAHPLCNTDDVIDEFLDNQFDRRR